LGMRAWKLMVIRRDGLPLTLQNALIRFAAATIALLPLGLGLIWLLVDRDRLSWQDRLSRTQLIELEKN